MRHRQSIDKLAKLLFYILGRRPDEFGLCPDVNGYVKIKDLMKVFSEEPGWHHVRPYQVREVLISTSLPPIELKNNLIRAVDRSHLAIPEPVGLCPKLLYCPVRRRAYPVALEKGLRSTTAGYQILLSHNIEMAKRLGRRIDPSPVILTVNSNIARKEGVTICRLGKELFLFDFLPTGCFSGPPLPKKRPETKTIDELKTQVSPKTPGSYMLDLSMDPVSEYPSKKGYKKRKNEWKRYRKQKNQNSVHRWVDK